VFYTPFEHVERRAKLVIVGITPGPTQLKMAYSKAQDLLRSGTPTEGVLSAVKAHAAFGGPLRSNLVKMLHHFGFGAILGVSNEADLWSSSAHLLHSTSVVPHAAFRDGKMFNGSFKQIMASPAFRTCFERNFVPELAQISRDAVFVALGDTPLAALDHCVSMGLLEPERVLGALAHPSTQGGSQVDVYLGIRAPSTLDAADPVCHRVPRLLANAERMKIAVARLNGGEAICGAFAARELPALQPTSSVTPVIKTAPPKPVLAATATPDGLGPNGHLHALVTRGRAKGTKLVPHVNADGCYVVSPTRFEVDYQRVPFGQPLEPYLRSGLSLRMSATGSAPRTPSLITPNSILGRSPE